MSDSPLGLTATALGLTGSALGLTATALGLVGLTGSALGLTATALGLVGLTATALGLTGLTATALGFAVAVARSGAATSARASAMSSAATGGRGVDDSGIFSTITGGGSGRPNHTIAPPSGSPRKMPIAIPPSSGARCERRFSARGVAIATFAKCADATFGFGAVDCSSDHSTKYSIAPSLTSLNGLAGTVLPGVTGGCGIVPGIGVRNASANAGAGPDAT